MFFRTNKRTGIVIGGFAAGVALGLFLATAKLPSIATAHAEDAKNVPPPASPVKALTDRDTSIRAPKTWRRMRCG